MQSAWVLASILRAIDWLKQLRTHGQVDFSLNTPFPLRSSQLMHTVNLVVKDIHHSLTTYI